jgi:hypothetical protein
MCEALYTRVIDKNGYDKSDLLHFEWIGRHYFKSNPEISGLLDASHFLTRYRGKYSIDYSWKFKRDAVSYNFIVDRALNLFRYIGGGD